MFISLVIFVPLLSGLVSATNYDVQVAPGGQLIYEPPVVNAVVGDTVTFHFNPKAHSLTESAFATPCSPLAGGIDSDLIPVDANATTRPTFVVNVEDTTARWFYCKQAGPPAHCSQGMVFAINPPTQGNTFEKYQEAAKASAGGASSTTSSAPMSTWTPPPAPVISTATVTVTPASGDVYTTTYASWENSPADPTPAAQPATHTIQVGASGLVFDPPSIVAAINDIITFQFHAKNHTATQSTFSSPCAPKDGGFDAGFNPVAADATTFPTFNVTVNDTLPIWVYCQQQGPPVHCQQGMVFAVNAPTSGPNTFTAFQDSAKHSGDNSSSSVSSGSPSSSGTTPGTTQGSGGKNGASTLVASLGASVLSVAALLAIAL